MNDAYKRLEKIRKPRIHIEYEVETEDGAIKKEIPFVIGVIGDFLGNAPGSVITQLRDREFIEINRDNFTKIMSSMQPGVKFKVNDVNLHLTFNSIKDFEPENLIQNIPELKKLYDARSKLRDLAAKVDCDESLEDLLTELIKDPKQLMKLRNHLQTNEVINHD